MLASIYASLNNEVIVLERNDKCGKKILLTGNGKCNYWNDDINLSSYNTDCLEKLDKILSNKEVVYNYLSNLGIYPKIKNGYYYPNSNQASSVREILCKELLKRNVNVVYNCKVDKIEKKNEKFIIYSNLSGVISCDKVIVAAGGNSCPKTGTDGSSYEILKSFHNINKVLPSLVPIVGKGNYFKEWNNLRVDCKLSLYVNDDFICSELGEVQLTDYGISGIPTFNLSGIVSKNLYLNNNVDIKIDFLPEVDNISDFLNNRFMLNKCSIEELFESVLPYQLVFMFLKQLNISKDDYWDSIEEISKEKLCNLIKQFNFNAIGTLDFDRSQVSTGGVSLNAINPETMESLNVSNLYLVGELLDVDGKCGGYNLAFAFISGYIAGKSV